ncbi:MAG: Ca2+/H+ antiporter, family [Clostridiales bacterium]|jgi:putative Ca2+/H+ antiporter (TMEM165/GDT1 family)|nr:Ca2+/H+ antiporter, family [Clostridiales bacterium]MDN5299302.1 Ca2+/H+ antiporter, family [Clostridiales bacterium]
MQDFLQAFALIFVAEMGDKTQIMAMAFATRYKISHILLGVGIGAFLNHGLAIMLGSLLNRYIPIEALQLVAGVLFVAFGLLSLSISEEDEESAKTNKYGAIATVAMSFFLGELGDKTQLTALTLSTQAQLPLMTLMGTVSGMVVVSSVGIFIGAKLGDRIPEHMIRLGSFIIFMLFGLNKIFTSSYVQSMGSTFTWILILMIALLTVYRFIIFRRQIIEISVSALRKKAKDLKAYTERIQNGIDQLCQGCDVCRDMGCVVGYMRGVLAERMKPGEIDSNYLEMLHNQNFDPDKAKVISVMINEYFEKYPDERETNWQLQTVQKVLEKIIEKNTIQFSMK